MTAVDVTVVEDEVVNVTVIDPTGMGTGGAVDSVNGHVGVVVLTPADLGAAVASDLAAETSARQSADTTETAARAAADTTETAARIAADSTNATAIATEATARANADALLIALSQKGAANGVTPLDSNALIPVSYLPSLSITDTNVVGSQAAMLALAAQKGDLAIRTDLNETFVLAGSDPTILSNWVQLPAPVGGVSSVNTRTGAVTGLAEASTTVSAGAGLSGGGDLSANRTISMPNVGTAGTFGDATHVVQITTDAQGRVSGATAVAITGLAQSDIVGLVSALAAKMAASTTLDAIPAAVADVSLGGHKATNVAAGTASTDAVNKGQLDALIAAADALVYKGVIDCSANPNYPAADAGWAYKVSVAGKIGGASGVNVEVGDLLLCLADGTASGNQATVGAFWDIIQVNIDGVVVGPASSTSGDIATFSGTSGKVVQDSGKSFDTDTALAANSDARIATQKAIKAYVDAETTRATAVEAGKSPKLLPTAVKTSTGYAIQAGDLVPCDTTTGPQTHPLPTTPADGTRVAIKIVAPNPVLHAVTYVCGGSDKINVAGGTVTSGILKMLGHAVNLQYVASGAYWLIVSDDLPLGQTDARYQSPLHRLTSTKVWTAQSPGNLTPGAGFARPLFLLATGTATAVTATTMTDTGANWGGNLTAGYVVTMGGVSATVTSSSPHVLTFSGGWSGATPSLGTYTVADRANVPGYPGPGIIDQIRISVGAGTMNQDAVLNIYTDNSATPDLSIDFGTLFLSQNDAQLATNNVRSTYGTTPGTGSQTITHGLGMTPRQVILSVNGVAPNASATWYATNYTSTTFDIVTAGTGGGTLVFDWQAIGPGYLSATTEHMNVQLSQWEAGINLANAQYVLRFPIPFTSGVNITISNVNNTDAGACTCQVHYKLGVYAPYRLCGTGATWKNGGTQAIPTPTVVAPGADNTLANVSGVSGYLVWLGLCEKGIPFQTATVSATSGNFTLTWNSQTTGNLAFNSTAAQVLTALQALTGRAVASCTTGGAATPGVITKNSHGFSTGDEVTITGLSATTGISNSVKYYVIRTAANTFELATTEANAIAGTALAFGGTTDTVTVTATAWLAASTVLQGPTNTTGVSIVQASNQPTPITATNVSLAGGSATVTIGTSAGPFAPYTYLERYNTVTIDGETTPSYGPSATEGTFQGNDYYMSGPGFSTPWALVTSANNSGASTNQGLDLLTLCGGLRFTSSFLWKLLSNAQQLAAAQASYVALYYKDVT